MEEFIVSWATEHPLHEPLRLLGALGARIVRESLHIGGWVAMWHPMETYLYGWWPVRRQGRIFRKPSTSRWKPATRRLPLVITGVGKGYLRYRRQLHLSSDP